MFHERTTCGVLSLQKGFRWQSNPNKMQRMLLRGAKISTKMLPELRRSLISDKNILRQQNKRQPRNERLGVCLTAQSRSSRK